MSLITILEDKMAKVVLDVDDKNVDTLLTILQNLKEGLICDIHIDKKRAYKRAKSIEAKPLQSSPEPVAPTSGKYIDPKTFKERLRRR